MRWRNGGTRRGADTEVRRKENSRCEEEEE